MQELVLRDIHQPPAAGWWPPAPGWWMVLAATLLVLASIAAWWWRRRRRRSAISALFDSTVARAGAGEAQVAAMSDLLRRAARRVDAAADKLDGSAWLLFLDGKSNDAAFSQGPGRVLLDGAFRRDVVLEDVAALQPIARARYLQLMGAGR